MRSLALLPTVAAAILGFTACTQQPSNPSTQMTASVQAKIVSLESFAASPKFIPVGLYSGAKPESLRVTLEGHVNALAHRIIARLPSGLSKHQALAEFSATLQPFENLDSEERDQVCLYIAADHGHPGN